MSENGDTDPLEEAWHQPLTGTNVGPWLVDIVEEMVRTGKGVNALDGPAAATLARVFEVGDPEKSVKLALMLLKVAVAEFGLRAHLAAPGKIDRDEITERVMESLRSAVGGQGPSSPFRQA